MITIRRAEDRGHANHGWLDTNHTFSFADYYDPNFMGFRALRVINEDRVKPGVGFGKHAHRDMEIISNVLEGTLAHSDSMGTGSKITPGEVQRMSAGTGVTHSEMNPSSDEPVHFLQIWILPSRAGLPPRYEQRSFDRKDLENQLRLIAGPNPHEGAVAVMQDANVHACVLTPGAKVSHTIAPDRYGFLHVARGIVELNGVELREGDGAELLRQKDLEIASAVGAELLLFDLA